MRSRAKEKFTVGTVQIAEKIKDYETLQLYCSNCKEPITVKLSKFI